MYRKRKSTAPHFRLPNPFNPVTGTDAPLHPPMKPLCRFILQEELTTDDEFAEALIEQDIYQWGPGMYHLKTVPIIVHNLETTTEDVYVFSAAEGDIGLAVWDFANHWRIIWFRTSNLVGACLAENHPGRGTEFDIYLGTWDPGAQKWIYDTETSVKAIDWRYGVPYPESGATGLFEARSSASNGTIYEAVAMDCESPGECGD